MGRAQNQKARDKNKAKLPQVPRSQIVKDDEELEIAKELDAQYELERKPGFPPTGVRRKD
ncbi:YfhD family protein [Bacillus taeanensis]|uniref:YfhD family protein n=1 Tax=Bacillus taeanensis TaxID=273032 RepID=A0A366XQ18_9BACI|nr:YfhD family protein [Bacillus taeanensis]RBW68007.1 YfhD family protein [Bacillus taeanensis]